jgi:hypothetical protein
MIRNGHEGAAGSEPDDMNELALVYAAAARERLAEECERLKNYTMREPVRALGLAFGVGVFLGWLIKRR